MKNSAINTKKLERVEVVMDSKNYWELHLIENYNRDIKETRIKKIITSMMLYGFVGTGIVIETRAFDGIVKRYIVDMQHRFHAAERLGLPVNYIVYKLKDDNKKNICELIGKLNSTATNWSTGNYLDTYAYLGVEEYIVMKEAKRETGLTLTDLQQMFLFGCGAKEVEAYKSGEMSFPNLKKSLKLKEALMKVKAIFPNKSYSRRKLFKILALCDGKYNKMADAIIKAHTNVVSGGMEIPENEGKLYEWLEKLYKNTFDC